MKQVPLGFVPFAAYVQPQNFGFAKKGTIPAIGRFTQEDPIRGNHPYCYVNNDPVNAADPYGTASPGDWVKITGRGKAASDGSGNNTIYLNNHDMMVVKINPGSAYPYALSYGNNVVIGWFTAAQVDGQTPTIPSPPPPNSGGNGGGGNTGGGGGSTGGGGNTGGDTGGGTITTPPTPTPSLPTLEALLLTTPFSYWNQRRGQYLPKFSNPEKHYKQYLENSKYNYNKLIYSQTNYDGQNPFKNITKIKMGNSSANENGCTWIAMYNAMRILGKPQKIAEIIFYLQVTESTFFGGDWGAHPPKNYFQAFGFTVTDLKNNSTLETTAKEYTAIMVTYIDWNWFGTRGHTFVAQWLPHYKHFRFLNEGNDPNDYKSYTQNSLYSYLSGTGHQVISLYGIK